METRTVGLTEAIEFHDATAEVGSEIPYQLRAIEIMLADSVEKLVPDAPEGYAEALAAGADVVAQDFRGALERFERAAADFLGERARRNESLPDFFQRVTALCMSMDGMLGTMKRNGISLKA